MPLTTAQLANYRRSLDPTEPLDGTDTLRYVNLDEVRGILGFSSTRPLRTTICMMDVSCQLFSGFPGSGKTTELKRLKEQFEGTVEGAAGNASSLAGDLPTHVVFIDAYRYIDNYSPLTVVDILRIVAYCMDLEAVQAETGKDAQDVEVSYLKSLLEFLKQPGIGIKDLKFEHKGLSFMLEFRNNRGFYDQAAKVLKDRFQHFVEQAHDVVSKAVLRLKKALNVERIVVIVDGLDKIQPKTEADREVIEKSVELVFSTHASLLRLPCHVIYTFPIWLRYRCPNLGNEYDLEPQIVPMVKIMSKERDESGEAGVVVEGVKRLIEVIERRVDVRAIFGDDLNKTLMPLVMASGGYLRDLLRLARNVIAHGATFPVDEDFIKQIIRKLAEDYRFTLYGSDLDIVVAVAQTHELPNEDPAQMARFTRLIEQRFILAYRNGDEWYDVHPVVRGERRFLARLNSKVF